MTWCCELSDLNKFIVTAEPNERFIYFIGCSVQDTLLAKEIGRIAYNYATRGMIYLVQKRSLGYYFDFEHYMIKASLTPKYSLVPFADSKTEQLRQIRGVRDYVGIQRAS